MVKELAENSIISYQYFRHPMPSKNGFQAIDNPADVVMVISITFQCIENSSLLPVNKSHFPSKTYQPRLSAA